MNKAKRLFTLIFRFPLDLFQMFVTYLPGRIGIALRYAYWKKQLKFIGRRVIIDVNVHFQNPEFISLDDNTWIDRNVIILAGPPNRGRIIFEKINLEFPLKKGEVYIGKNTHIAPNSVLSGIGGLYIGCNCTIAANSSVFSFSHHYRNLLNREDQYQYSFTSMARLDQQSMILSPIYIGDYSAVGLHTVILPGTTIKRGCWVAAGSIVSGSSDEQTVIYHKQDNLIKSINHLIIKE